MAHIQELQNKLQKLTEDFRSSTMSISKKFLEMKFFSSHLQDIAPFLSSEDVEDLLESIEPSDFSAKRLKLELANQFKRPLIILEYIKTEEKLLVKRALQFSWIYKEKASPLTNPKTLVRVILPSLSYSTRLKLISGLSNHNKDEPTCEEIFTLIQQKYGSLCALKLLPACSISFIQNCLKTEPYFVFMLSGKQSLKIAEKDTTVAFDLVLQTLEYIKSTENVHPIVYEQRNSGSIPPEIKKLNEGQTQLLNRLRSTHQKTIQYLSISNPQQFLNMYQNFSNAISFPVTPQSTKILITTCKDQIISNAGKFKEILSSKVMHKCLTSLEYTDFIVSLLPNLIEWFVVEHEELLNTWLNPIPFQRRWETLEQAFMKKYGKEITSSPEYISPLIMQIMPVEIREKWAFIKLQLADAGRINYTTWEDLPQHREGFWHSFLTLDKSIPKLKEFLRNESDMTTRSELLKYLIKTCLINQRDTKALTELCRFVVSKYRNDSQQLRNDFVNELDRQFKFKSLLEEVELWEILTDFIKLSAAYKEPEPTNLINGVIRHRLFKNLPLNDLENTFKNLVTANRGYWIGDFPQFPNSLEIDGKYLQFHLNQLEKMFPKEKLISAFTTTESTTIQNAVLTLLRNITNRKLMQNKSKNKKFIKNFPIKDHPWFMSRLQEICELETGEEQQKIQLEVIKLIKSDSEAMKFYLKSLLVTTPHAFVIDEYMKKDPVQILKHIDTITPFILGLEGRAFKSYKTFLMRLKTQGFSQISSSLIEMCLEIGQDDTNDEDERRNALVILSYLWDSINYINTLSLFYPTSPTIDLEDLSFETQYTVRKAVLESLSNTSFPNQCLPSILKFCLGDYLKVAIGPLYSAVMHCPQQEAVKFLKEDLLDSPISVKKHAIKLLCMISEQDDLEELLTYLWDSETNLSLREILVSKICIFMIDSLPSENTWNFMKRTICSLNQKDKGALAGLLMPYQLQCISPSVILSQYLYECFKLIITLPVNLYARDSLLQYFVHIVTQNISKLSQDFIKSILEKLLFEFELGESEEVSGLVIALAATFILTPDASDKESKFSNRLSTIINKFSLIKDNWKDSKAHLVKRNIGCVVIETAMNFINPAKNALRTFVEEVCKKCALMLKENVSQVTSKNFSGVLSSILEAIKINFDFTETFTERIYLQLSIIFIEYMPVADKGEMENASNQNVLFEAGQKLQDLTDLIVSEYHPIILTFYEEKVRSFFEEIIMLEESSIIFLIYGLISEKIDGKVISIENKMLACQILPSNLSKTLLIESKYKEVLGIMRLFPESAIQTVLNDKMI